MGRRATVASVAVAVAIAGGVLAGCGDSGQGLAEQACAHVHRSLDLYTEAERTTDPSTADARVKQAYDQLRLALPLAADADLAERAVERADDRHLGERAGVRGQPRDRAA